MLENPQLKVRGCVFLELITQLSYVLRSDPKSLYPDFAHLSHNRSRLDNNQGSYKPSSLWVVAMHIPQDANKPSQGSNTSMQSD